MSKFPYKVISNPEEMIGKKVHVEGWTNGSVFFLLDFKNGIAFLQSPKKKKNYTTSNRLLYLRKDQYE